VRLRTRRSRGKLRSDSDFQSWNATRSQAGIRERFAAKSAERFGDSEKLTSVMVADFPTTGVPSAVLRGDRIGCSVQKKLLSP
jgi:hypothetical protein